MFSSPMRRDVLLPAPSDRDILHSPRPSVLCQRLASRCVEWLDRSLHAGAIMSLANRLSLVDRSRRVARPRSSTRATSARLMPLVEPAVVCTD
jgi:hypothetical protein